MTPKERLLRALRFEPTDRPPLYCSVVPQLAQALYERLGRPYTPGIDSPLSGNRISWQELMVELGADCLCVAACAPDDAPTVRRPDGLLVNEWGVGMRNHGLYDDFELFPLATASSVEEIDSYPFPKADAPGRFRQAEETIARYGGRYGIIGDLECSIFEASWYLTGLEKLLMDMALERPYVDALFDRVAAYHTAVGVRLVQLGADMIWCGDDFGTQNGPLISVEMFRRYFKPRIAKLFAALRAANPEIKIAWHSCGSMLPLIPEFLELDLDVLNPIQPLARGMDPQELKAAYGDRLAFFGGICVQKLLPQGTPREIAAEVRRLSEILGSGGGYLMAPAHNIQADTPVDNVLAMFDAVKELAEIS